MRPEGDARLLTSCPLLFPLGGLTLASLPPGVLGLQLAQNAHSWLGTLWKE